MSQVLVPISPILARPPKNIRRQSAVLYGFPAAYFLRCALLYPVLLRGVSSKRVLSYSTGISRVLFSLDRP